MNPTQLKEGFNITATCQRNFILGMTITTLGGAVGELLRPYPNAYTIYFFCLGLVAIAALIYFIRFEIRLYGWLLGILISAGSFFLAVVIPFVGVFIVLIAYCVGTRRFIKSLREYNYKRDRYGRVVDEFQNLVST